MSQAQRIAAPEPTDHPHIDEALEELAGRKKAWVELPVARKVAYLEELVARADALGDRWVDAAVKGKRIEPGSPWVGEEWVTGPWAFIAGAVGLAETLRHIDARGTPKLPGVRALADGRAAVKVFPVTIWDGLLLNGMSAEVWMQDGVTPDNLKDHIGEFYRREDKGEGAVALVLGAGNIASIPPLDTLYRMFVMGHVVVLKMNPVNAWLGPIFEDVFEPLVADGFIRFVYGGAAEGKHLTQHSLVDELHLTGSERTHDAIVFGTGAEGAARKAKDEPVIDKPFTSELGGVGGTIVVPGDWNDADLRYQAEEIITQKLHNSGHNCVAAQVLLLPESWDLADRLLDEIRTVLRELPHRVSWYPGADTRQADVVERHPTAETFGGEVPRTLLHDIDSDSDHFCFEDEFFGVVLAVTRIPGSTPEAYLRNAVAFANDGLAGTLGVNMIIDPATRRKLGSAFDKAITDLRFGAIGVNAWNACAFLLPHCTWGAYPGHARNDIQSGSGVVHNAFMFDRPEKTVVTGPFAPFPRAVLQGEFHMSPKPLWFVTNRTAHTTARRVARFAANPGWGKLPAIFAAALRG